MKNTYTLIRKAQSGDKQSENMLVSQNIALVHSCARRLRRDGFEYEDLIQTGSLALLKAIRRFDVSYNVCFSTYAVPIITGDIKRYMRDNSSIKVSRSLREIYMRISKLREEMSNNLMREASLSELSEMSGYPAEKIIMALEACAPCDSLERSIGSDSSDNICLGDVISLPDTTNSQTDKIALKCAIKNLGERERKVLIMRYFRGKTQTEVAGIIGVSQVQISRIEKKILKSLHEMLA